MDSTGASKSEDPIQARRRRSLRAANAGIAILTAMSAANFFFGRTWLDDSGSALVYAMVPLALVQAISAQQFARKLKSTRFWPWLAASVVVSLGVGVVWILLVSLLLRWWIKPFSLSMVLIALAASLFAIIVALVMARIDLTPTKADSVGRPD